MISAAYKPAAYWCRTCMLRNTYDTSAVSRRAALMHRPSIIRRGAARPPPIIERPDATPELAAGGAAL